MTFLCRLPSYKLREKQDFVQPNFFFPLKFVLISLNPTRFFQRLDANEETNIWHFIP